MIALKGLLKGLAPRSSRETGACRRAEGEHTAVALKILRIHGLAMHPQRMQAVVEMLTCMRCASLPPSMGAVTARRPLSRGRPVPRVDHDAVTLGLSAAYFETLSEGEGVSNTLLKL